MRAASRVVLVVAAGACASGGSAPSPIAAGPVEQTVTVSGGGGGTASITMTHDDVGQSHLLASPPQRVMAALPAAFDSVGVRPSLIDPATRTVGNTAFKVHARIKGVPLSRYIDCGMSTQIGPNADSYDVVISLVAQVRPAEGGASSLVIGFEAMGKPATFAQDYSRCATKGALESRLAETVQRLLAAR